MTNAKHTPTPKAIKTTKKGNNMKTTLTEEQAKIQALAVHLQGQDSSGVCDPEKFAYYLSDAESLINDGDYLVLTNEEADEKATEYIKDSLWAFNASFILSECGLDLSGEESLKYMQEKSCESSNDFILSLVEKTCGLGEFVESAISADGRGHFLSQYDGEENEETVEGKTYYIYRCN